MDSRRSSSRDSSSSGSNNYNYLVTWVVGEIGVIVIAVVVLIVASYNYLVIWIVTKTGVVVVAVVLVIVVIIITLLHG